MKILIRKIASILMVACIMVGLLSIPITVIAAVPVQLTLTSAKGLAGEDIIVSLNISADSKLSAADFTIAYDEEKLLLKEAKEGSATAGGYSSINPNAPEKDGLKTIKQAFISDGGVSVAGSMLDLTFTVAPGWTGSTPLVLTVGDFFDGAYGEIAYKIENGTVTIGDGIGSNATTTVAQATTQEKENSTSVRKSLTVLLVVICVLAIGAGGALIIIKKRQNKAQ